MTVHIAFYKGRDRFLDRAIQWWTNGRYSHCELVIDGVSYTSSPMDGGIRKKVIIFKPENWDIYTIVADKEYCLEWFTARLGASYDWVGLLGFIIPLRLEHSKKWFCSEAVGSALGLMDTWSLSPDALYKKLITGETLKCMTTSTFKF